MYNYPDELYHHGIKGQKWGVRNGPPYPLNGQTHSSVVKSASRGRSGKRGRVGGLFERQVEKPGYFIRKSQEKGLMDDKTRYTKEGIKQGVKMGALSGGLGNAIGTYAGLRLAGANKKSAAVTAGAAGAAGALGGGLGAYTGGKIRNHIINKKIKKGKISGYDEDKSARRKRIARNVAIGAGLGAAALGTAYAIKKGRRSSLATSKATALGDKANTLFGRARAVEGASREGATWLRNQATRASGQARRYTNIASGYAKRRNIGIAAGALGLGTAGLGAGSYIRDRRRRRKIGRR